MATAWLAAAPPTADLAAHAFRAWLWDAEGFTTWNAQWYGGHHVPGYSLLFPPLSHLLGPRIAVALAGVASAAGAVALARRGDRPALAAWLAASGAAANLVVGRGPFALGVALGALALWLSLSGRRGAAALAAASCTAASPVAGVFLCVAAVGARRAELLLFAAAAGLLTAALFPEGGEERFVPTAFWPMLAVCLAAMGLLRGRARLAAVAYAALLVAAFLLPTPMGHNALRLGALAGPALLAARGRGPAWALAGVGAVLLYLQWLPAVRAVAESAGDPAARAAYHAPVLAFLGSAAAPGDRVEAVPTRNHWEANWIARRHALARGWERQLDLKVNRLFYDGRPITPARYEAWLRREGVRWVALADAPPDLAARQEAELLRAGLPFLRPAFASARWRVWELRDPPPRAPIRAAGPSELVVRAGRAGRIVLRGRRWSPYWRVVTGSAGVAEAGGWLAVDARAPGRIRLRAAP